MEMGDKARGPAVRPWPPRTCTFPLTFPCLGFFLFLGFVPRLLVSVGVGRPWALLSGPGLPPSPSTAS